MEQHPSEDDELVRAMRGGDQSALGRVIDKYTAYAGTIIWNIVQKELTRTDAEDILSGTFYLLWRSAGRIRPGKLKAYLAVIARRQAISTLRSKTVELPLGAEEAPLSVPGPEEESIRREEYAALRALLEAMPEPDRSIFIRHYYFCQSTGEIALAMALNVNTVQSKLRRGRARLRREMTERGCFHG